jgi:hypothetical protein
MFPEKGNLATGHRMMSPPNRRERASADHRIANKTADLGEVALHARSVQRDEIVGYGRTIAGLMKLGLFRVHGGGYDGLMDCEGGEELPRISVVRADGWVLIKNSTRIGIYKILITRYLWFDE